MGSCCVHSQNQDVRDIKGQKPKIPTQSLISDQSSKTIEGSVNSQMKSFVNNNN